MKKLSILGILAGAALLTATPLSSADAQIYGYGSYSGYGYPAYSYGGYGYPAYGYGGFGYPAYELWRLLPARARRLSRLSHRQAGCDQSRPLALRRMPYLDAALLQVSRHTSPPMVA